MSAAPSASATGTVAHWPDPRRWRWSPGVIAWARVTAAHDRGQRHASLGRWRSSGAGIGRLLVVVGMAGATWLCSRRARPTPLVRAPAPADVPADFRPRRVGVEHGRSGRGSRQAPMLRQAPGDDVERRPLRSGSPWLRRAVVAPVGGVPVDGPARGGAGCSLSIAPPGGNPLGARSPRSSCLRRQRDDLVREARHSTCRVPRHHLGRLPIVTPLFVYAAAVGAAGLMLAPPFSTLFAQRTVVAIALGNRHGPARWSLVATLPRAYAAPAYTQRPAATTGRASPPGSRLARPVIGKSGRSSPGSTSHPTHPADGRRATVEAASVGVPWGRLQLALRVRADDVSRPAPAEISGVREKSLDRGQWSCRSLSIPREPGLHARLLPPGIAPARSSLPGVVRPRPVDRDYVAIPAEGIAWEASRRTPPAARNDAASPCPRRGCLAARLAGAAGLAAQERAVWIATATWVVPHGQWGAITPPPPLR